MKVRVVFDLDIDEQLWREEFGVSPGRVEADVRNEARLAAIAGLHTFVRTERTKPGIGRRLVSSLVGSTAR